MNANGVKFSSRQASARPAVEASEQTEHRMILMGMFRVVMFVAIGRLAGAAKEMALAYRYGVGDLTDVYVTLITFILWPVALWLTAVSAILVPLEARESDAAAIRQFRSELTSFSILLGIVISLAALGWFNFGGRWDNGSWSSLGAEWSKAMLSIGVLLIPLGLLIGLGSTWTLASGRHTNTLLEGVPALTIALAVLLFPAMGGAGLVWSTVAGFCVHLACLVAPLIHRGELAAPSTGFRSKLWRPFVQGFGLLLIGQALMASVVLVDQMVAVQLGPGTPSTLSYSNRVLAFVMGIGSLAVTRATLPVFTRAAHDPVRLMRLAKRWMTTMMACGLVVVALSTWLAEPVVTLLFERGAFTHEDTVRVASAFRAALPQMPLFLAGLVLSSVASSQGRYGLVFIACAGALLTKLVANHFLVQRFGLSGLLLAWTPMYAAHATVLAWGVMRRHPDPKGKA